MIAGREFTSADRFGSPLVCVINESTAKKFFPGQNALGRHVGFGSDNTDAGDGWDCQGPEDVNLREQPRRYVYAPFLQDENPNQATIYVRTRSRAGEYRNRHSASGAAAGCERAGEQLEEHGGPGQRVAVRRAPSGNAMGFLWPSVHLVAAIGLYGVMAYSVTQDTRDWHSRGLGGRALGSDRAGDEGGCDSGRNRNRVGLPLALACPGSSVRNCSDLEANDPLTIAIATFSLAAVSLAAGYIPGGACGAGGSDRCPTVRVGSSRNPAWHSEIEP